LLPLLYYAITTWFVKVSAVREELKQSAAEINWQPSHIKAGRFGKWLDGARDWAISRNRYWGAPMPIWVNDADVNDYLVVSSLDELVKLAGLSDKPEDLHRPGIDAVKIVKDGKTYTRVEEVFDCWFESGSMPVAQQHYPFENEGVFKETFPADYIGEGLDQTRLWFYVLHVLNTIAFGKPAYKNVLVNGMVMAADGQKLSKRLKNYPPVEDVFSVEGADTLRLYLLGNDQAVGGDYMRFSRDAMRDISRNVFGTLWNSYSFLTMYAEIDGWEPPKTLSEPKSDNVLDMWLLARLNATIAEVTEAADAYALARAIRSLRELIEDLSNWYVRRSRRRFWKSEDDGDKHSAYVTLHYALARIAQLLAPWAPFVSDKLWRELTAGTDEAQSVHLSDWPKAGVVDEHLLEQMAITRTVVTEGLGVRGEAKIKVRQPLAKLTYSTDMLSPELEQIIADEVNVKEVSWGNGLQGAGTELDTKITPELKAEGLMRDVVRHVQSARKVAGLEVDDRIVLTLESDSKDLTAAIAAHADIIALETLATELKTTGASGEVPVKVDGHELFIEVTKA
jgi:isoleucyl-tRNA synthetase